MTTLALHVEPLGDQAVLINAHTHERAVNLARMLTCINPDWLHDVVPAYHQVGVYFDSMAISFTELQAWILSYNETAPDDNSVPVLHIIPVCYAFGPDLPAVAEALHLTPNRVIELHTSVEYRVFAIGFVPGFPYLGDLPIELRHLPRLASPRVRVEPGSVGLTGNQTGIYPLARPGGWNLIGRTPLEIVNEEENFFPIHVGDVVRFYPIAQSEWDVQPSRLAETRTSNHERVAV